MALLKLWRRKGEMIAISLEDRRSIELQVVAIKGVWVALRFDAPASIRIFPWEDRASAPIEDNETIQWRRGYQRLILALEDERTITIKVLYVQRSRVQFGIDAPLSIGVDRAELHTSSTVPDKEPGGRLMRPT